MLDRLELDFDDLPAVLPSYFRALMNRGSGLSTGETIPCITARVNALEVRAERLARYRKVCGFARSAALPLTYPHVLAFPMHMAVLTQKRFPLKLLGLIHVRNHIIQQRTVGVREPLDIIVSTGGHRNVSKGIEFDLITRVNDVDGVQIWHETSVMLWRANRGRRRASAGHEQPPDEAEFVRDEEAIWRIPADLGRRYAIVAGDYNPIHLSAWSARLFGFPRAIATGMWLNARAAAALQPYVKAEAYSLSVAFSKPVPLPSTLVFKKETVDEGIDFVLASQPGNTDHLSGEMRYL